MKLCVKEVSYSWRKHLITLIRDWIQSLEDLFLCMPKVQKLCSYDMVLIVQLELQSI